MDNPLKSTRLTIKDVAKALNVSTTTVSRALSGKGRISEDTVQRVQAFIKENNYVPNAIAQSLADQRTYNIGFIMPRGDSITDHAFFQDCLAGVFWTLSDTQYDVLVVMNEDRGEQRLVRALERGKLDGAIVSRSHVDDQAVKLLQDAGIPFVLIGSSQDPSVYRVDHDHRAACGELTRYLLSENRKLALLGGDRRLFVTKDRLRGFLDACEEASYPKEDRLYFDLDSQEQVEEALDSALGSGADCLVCMDDRICGMALTALHGKGLRIPQDVQVASFYDSYVLEHDGITSLTFPAGDLGEAACRLLLAQMDGQTSENMQTVGYDLSIRSSTEARKNYAI